MIAPGRPPLPIDCPAADGAIPTELAEVLAQVLLEAAEQQERPVGARLAEEQAGLECRTTPQRRSPPR